MGIGSCQCRTSIAGALVPGESLPVLRDILDRLEGIPPRETMSSDCIRWLRERGLTESVLADLSECVHAGAIPIGHVWLSPLGEIRLENDLEENAPCIEHGFLIVGSGLNGDPIALEIASGRMAFVSHDLLWERDYREFEECVVRSPLGFDDFWTAAVEEADFPVDADDAVRAWRTE